jgi:hypothetical protein
MLASLVRKPTLREVRRFHGEERLEPRNSCREGSFRVGCGVVLYAQLSLEPFSSLSVVKSVNDVKAKMKTPELSDLYRFFIEMNGNEEKARTEYERFMAGELGPHVLAYCRDCVEGEEREHVDQIKRD